MTYLLTRLGRPPWRRAAAAACCARVAPLALAPTFPLRRLLFPKLARDHPQNISYSHTEPQKLPQGPPQVVLENSAPCRSRSLATTATTPR